MHNFIRYKFYREHKYLSFVLNDLERLIAKTNFQIAQEVVKVTEQFKAAIELLKGHAEYEDNCLHVLLKQKNSQLYEHIEEDHGTLDETLNNLQLLLDRVNSFVLASEKVEAGYQFYVGYRKFVGENLIHLHEEETIILPELHRLYSDEELKKVEAKTYAVMSSDDLIDMLQVLFPHMNASDKRALLSDIKECQPAKYAVIWPKIQLQIPEHELPIITL
ncbi:hemerythrin domain-containing protein [Candidatus Dependentiae bacterium]|nr:hemerythrin domain-containing protein [Candidatus Dependentiae bacterium]